MIKNPKIEQAPSQKYIAYISLGSNLGDTNLNLGKAISKITEKAGAVLAVSSICQTEPWGYQSSNEFLNQVIQLETSLSPTDLLSVMQAIEKEMGRKKKTGNSSYQDRVIDLDLLFYDDLILESETLILPHPLCHKRKFILEPLTEIAPELFHPILKISIKELLRVVM